MKEVIKIGQLWRGDTRTMWRIAKVVELGSQPKRRKITVQDVAAGYTFKLYESEFRTLYYLHKDVPQGEAE